MAQTEQEPSARASLEKMLVKTVDIMMKEVDEGSTSEGWELTDPMGGLISLDRTSIKTPVGTLIRIR